MNPIARMYKLRDEAGIERVRNYKKPPMRFRASELAECKRKIWYRLSGYVPAPDTGFTDDWGVDGDVHHDIVRQQLLAHGIRLAGITVGEDGTTDEDMFLVHNEEYDGRNIQISMRADGWIFTDEYGWVPMEIKSVEGWTYKYMNDAYQKGGEERLLEYITEKRPSYIYQMHAVMRVFQNLPPEKLPIPAGEPYTLDKTMLIIKDRANCHIGFHSDKHGVIGGPMVPFNQETWDKIVRRVYTTKGKVLDGKAPMAEYTSSARQCGYCRYRYLCHDAAKRKASGHEPHVLYPEPRAGIHIDAMPS